MEKAFLNFKNSIFLIFVNVKWELKPLIVYSDSNFEHFATFKVFLRL